MNATERPGYLLDWELRLSAAWLVVTSADPLGLHRENCSYLARSEPRPRINPEFGALAFEAEQQRNRSGGPRTVYFCERCMVQRVKAVKAA